MLPDILDPICIPADKGSPESLHTAFNRFGVTFERGLTPADNAVCGLYSNEDPSGRDTKCLS